MKRSHEIDEFIRAGLQNTADSACDWDIPSERVWEGVERHLRPTVRRRSAFWWILGGLLLFLLGLVAILFRSTNISVPLAAESDSVREIMTVEPVIPHDEGAISSVDHTQSMAAPSNDIFSSNAASLTDSEVTRPHEQPTNTTDVSKPADVTHASVQIHTLISSPDNYQTGVGTSDELSSAIEHRIEHVRLLTSRLIPVTLPAAAFNRESSTPIIPMRKTSAWSVALAMSPSFGTRDIHVPASHPRVRRDLLLQQENPTMQLGLRLAVARDFSSRWSLGIGVDYNSYVLNSASLHQIRYTRAGEVQNGRGNFENRLNLSLNTSYGQVNTDIVIERSSDAMINENQFINIALNTRQAMQVLQIPVSVKYNIPLGLLTMSMRGGIAANMLLENSIEFSTIESLNTGIVRTRASRILQLTGSRSFALGYQIGTGVEMPLNRQWSVMIEPGFSGYLQPVYQNRHVVIYPHVFNIYLGARYTFR